MSRSPATLPLHYPTGLLFQIRLLLLYPLPSIHWVLQEITPFSTTTTHYALLLLHSDNFRLQFSSSVRVRRIGGLVRSCVCSCLSKTFEKHEVVFVSDCEVTCAVRVCVQHKMTTKNIGNNPKFKKWISGFSQEKRRHSINNVSKPLRIPTRPDVYNNCLYFI